MDKTLAFLISLQTEEGGIRRTPGGPLYPEVSGQLIPTFLRLGLVERAHLVANYLFAAQNDDGSFFGPDEKTKYTFDTLAAGSGLFYLAKDSYKVRQAAIKAAKFAQVHAYEEVAYNRWLNMMLMYLPFLHKVGGEFTKDAAELAERGLRSIENDWVPECDIAYDNLPRVHFVAYFLQGLLTYGKLVKNKKFEKQVVRTVRKILERMTDLVPSRIDSNFMSLGTENNKIPATLQVGVLCTQIGQVDVGRKLWENVKKYQGEDGSLPRELGGEKVCWSSKWFLDLEWILKTKRYEVMEDLV